MSSNPAATPLTKRLTSSVFLSGGELDALARLQSTRRLVKRRSDIIQQDEPHSTLYAIHDGWAYHSKLLPDGRRQVVDFALAGTLVGFRSSLFRQSDCTISAVTDLIVSEVPASRFYALLQSEPRIGHALLWLISTDEARLVEHIVDLGRRDAVARTAHLFLEFAWRLDAAGTSALDGYACPVTQYVLADALGLSAIHLNRVLRQLREQRVMTFRDNEVTIHDMEALLMLAECDASDRERLLPPANLSDWSMSSREGP